MCMIMVETLFIHIAKKYLRLLKKNLAISGEMVYIIDNEKRKKFIVNFCSIYLGGIRYEVPSLWWRNDP